MEISWIFYAKFCHRRCLPSSPTLASHPGVMPLNSIHLVIIGQSLNNVWLCATPMDCKPPGSSVHGIPQARILKWVAISSSRRSSWPRDWTWISCASCIGRQILYHWATRQHENWETKDDSETIPSLGVQGQFRNVWLFIYMHGIHFWSFARLNNQHKKDFKNNKQKHHDERRWGGARRAWLSSEV